VENERLTGKVDWYDLHRGFGVVSGDDGNEYFVHHTNLTLDQKCLYMEERVEFSIKEREDGNGLCMQSDDETLIVHAFYRSGKNRDACWRAKLFRHEDGRIFHMPDKEDYRTGKKKKTSWRMVFDYFLDDLEEMFRSSRE